MFWPQGCHYKSGAAKYWKRSRADKRYKKYEIKQKKCGTRQSIIYTEKKKYIHRSTNSIFKCSAPECMPTPVTKKSPVIAILPRYQHQLINSSLVVLLTMRNEREMRERMWRVKGIKYIYTLWKLLAQRAIKTRNKSLPHFWDTFGCLCCDFFWDRESILLLQIAYKCLFLYMWICFANVCIWVSLRDFNSWRINSHQHVIMLGWLGTANGSLTCMRQIIEFTPVRTTLCSLRYNICQK